MIFSFRSQLLSPFPVFKNLVVFYLFVCFVSPQGKYNNWDKVDPAELFSRAPTEKKEANPKLNMVKFLQVGPGG